MLGRLVLLLALVTVSGELADPDIWWNVAAGVAAIEGGAKPPLELFGVHGCPDATAVDSVVGWSVFGALWKLGGLWALLALRVGVIAAIAVLLARRAAALGLVGSVGAAAVVAALSFRASVRGELFGWLFFAVLGALVIDALSRARDEAPAPRRLLAVALCALVWGFLHPSAPLAVVATGAAALVAVLLGHSSWRRALPIVVAAGLGALPHVGALLGLGVERQIAEQLGFREWAPLLTALRGGWRDVSLMPLIVLVGVGLLSALSVRRMSARGAISLGFVLVGALLAINSVRHIGFFAVALGLALPAWEVLAPRVRVLAASAAALTVLAVIIVRAPSHPLVAGAAPWPERLVPSRLAPVASSSWLRAHGARGVVLAPLHLSNWLLLRNGPDLRVVWSGRRTYEVGCGLETMRALADPSAFDAVLARQRRVGHPIDYVVLEHPAAGALLQHVIDAGWRLVALDLRLATFARPGLHDDLPLAPFDIDALAAAETHKLEPERALAMLRETEHLWRAAAARDVTR